MYVAILVPPVSLITNHHIKRFDLRSITNPLFKFHSPLSACEQVVSLRVVKPITQILRNLVSHIQNRLLFFWIIDLSQRKQEYIFDRINLVSLLLVVNPGYLIRLVNNDQVLNISD